jgi:hypothetical protein
MKSIVFIFLLFTVISNSYGQKDSLDQIKVQSIVREFSSNSFLVSSYRKLPKFIRNYLNQKSEYKCGILNSKYNGKDIGSGSQGKNTYIAKEKDNYLVSYEHKGKGYHCHAIILETNGKEVINGYNVVYFNKQNNVTEFINMLQQPGRFKVINYNKP